MPGEQPTQGRIHNDKRAGKGGTGMCAVLDAGNPSSIPPMDVLCKLVAEDEACIRNMNPVSEALDPVIGQALMLRINAGFLEVVYGGVECAEFSGCSLRYPRAPARSLRVRPRLRRRITASPSAEQHHPALARALVVRPGATTCDLPHSRQGSPWLSAGVRDGGSRDGRRPCRAAPLLPAAAS